MAFGMFTAQASPVAIDFGSSAVKLLQTGAGDRPPLLAAAELPVPDSLRTDPDKLMLFFAEWLPKVMREGKFKGKRAVMAIPAAQTFVQHMQINEADAASNRDEACKQQLQATMGCAPSNIVVRTTEVCQVHRNGQAQREIICFAIAKDTVMKYIDLLRRCKLEVVGVHTDTMAMIRSFDHINRRNEDAEVGTLFVDLGWGGTRAAITHGQQIVFARYIPIGGKHFDQQIASALHCDVASARAHRMTLQSAKSSAPPMQNDSMHGMSVLNAGVSKGAVGGSARGVAAVATERRSGVLPASLNAPLPGVEAPRKAVNVDMSELLDTITDELSMCLRYHQSLYGDRNIDRAILVGGESRQTWLCQHIVKVLGVPAQMGDPLARLDSKQAPSTPNLTLGQPLPGWAVACGLCSAPTDL